MRRFWWKKEYIHTGSQESFVLINKDVYISGGWNNDFSEQVYFSILRGNGHIGLTVQDSVVAVLEKVPIQGGYYTIGLNSALDAHPIVSPTYKPTSDKWYVTQQGDDTNECLSPSTACATINRLLNKASNRYRETILVEKGEYIYTGSKEGFVLLDLDVSIFGGWNSDFSQQVRLSSLRGNGHIGLRVQGSVMAVLEKVSVQGGYYTIDSNSALDAHPIASPKINRLSKQSAKQEHIKGNLGGIYNQGTLTLIESGGGGWGDMAFSIRAP